MRVTVLDHVTGQTTPLAEDFSVWWWTEGNGSCDCNRAIFVDDDLAEAMEAARGDASVCLGATRFYVVDVAGDSEGESKAAILARINAAYPPLSAVEEP